MVSERQSGFESRTDNAGSEGAVEMLAVTVLSMEMLLLAAQQRVCCGWHAGRQRNSNACPDGAAQALKPTAVVVWSSLHEST